MILDRRERWQDYASCAGLAPLFDSDCGVLDAAGRTVPTVQYGLWQAAVVCGRCPVRLQCGLHAETARVTAVEIGEQPDGVYAGVLYRQGRKPLPITVACCEVCGGIVPPGRSPSKTRRTCSDGCADMLRHPALPAQRAAHSDELRRAAT